MPYLRSVKKKLRSGAPHRFWFQALQEMPMHKKGWEPVTEIQISQTCEYLQKPLTLLQSYELGNLKLNMSKMEHIIFPSKLGPYFWYSYYFLLLDFLILNLFKKFYWKKERKMKSKNLHLLPGNYISTSPRWPLLAHSLCIFPLFSLHVHYFWAYHSHNILSTLLPISITELRHLYFQVSHV